MQHTASGRKGPASDGVVLLKKKAVRNTFLLQRIQDFAKMQSAKKRELSVDNKVPHAGNALYRASTTEQEQKSQKGQEKRKLTDDCIETTNSLSLVRSASQGTLVSSSTSQSPRSTGFGTPRDCKSPHEDSMSPTPTRMSILLTPFGHLSDSTVRWGEVSSIKTVFKTRKKPVVGDAYQISTDRIPKVVDPPNPQPLARGETGLLCRPNTIDNIVSFETLRGAQYLPGLIVKIHPPNLVDSTCGDERVSIKGVPVVPILGMVISKITTPMTPDTTLRLAVERKQCARCHFDVCKPLCMTMRYWRFTTKATNLYLKLL